MSTAEYYAPPHSRHHHGSTLSSVYNGPVIVDERSRDPNELALVETHRERRAVSSDGRHHHHHHHQRRDSRDESDTESEFSRTRSRSVDGYEEATKVSRREEAAKAALAAAAIEAFRSRKEPGGITGKQALTRAATAAVASGAIDYIIDRKKGPHESSKTHIAESVVGGLVAQRVLQGHARDDGGGHGGSLGSLGELVALGAAALGGDKLINHEAKKHRSRSGSSASRDSRRSSEDSRRNSRGSSRHSHHRRSSSSKRYHD